MNFEIEEASIRGLYEQRIDGWNKANAETFVASFAQDANFIPLDGSQFTAAVH